MIPYSACVLLFQTERMRKNVALLPILLLSVDGEIKCRDYGQERCECTDWLTDWLIDWLIDWLTDWLIDWVTYWLTDWHWLIDWLTDWLTDGLTDWLTDWMIDRLTDWGTDWLTEWLTDWLTDWLTKNLISLYEVIFQKTFPHFLKIPNVMESRYSLPPSQKSATCLYIETT
jgi:hypothetical protein